MRFTMIFAFAASLLIADEHKEKARTDTTTHDRQATSAEQRTTRARTEAGVTTVTGVIDQKDGKWVLSSPEAVEPIATLRSKGFKDTNFARFVGMKVNVRGRMVTEGDRKVFEVSRVNDIEHVGPGREGETDVRAPGVK